MTAAENLGKTHDPAWFPLLLEVADQHGAMYLSYAAESGGDAAMTALLARLRSPDPNTLGAVINALGNTGSRLREHRAGTNVELLWQDIRYGMRQLRRNRGFTLTAVVTLGLGIGATTAIFSAVYSLLLHPLPYNDSSQLITVTSVWPKSKSDAIISPDFVAAQNEMMSFEQFAGYAIGDDNLTGVGDPLKVTRASVTANFFTTLGVVPQLGRTFLAGEDRSGGSSVILLSDRLWRNKFHADHEIIGKIAILNGKDQTIVGVLPPTSVFPISRQSQTIMRRLRLSTTQLFPSQSPFGGCMS
jgi:hypothetical protein